MSLEYWHSLLVSSLILLFLQCEEWAAVHAVGDGRPTKKHAQICCCLFSRPLPRFPGWWERRKYLQGLHHYYILIPQSELKQTFDWRQRDWCGAVIASAVYIHKQSASAWSRPHVHTQKCLKVICLPPRCKLWDRFFRGYLLHSGNCRTASTWWLLK